MRFACIGAHPMWTLLQAIDTHTFSSSPIPAPAPGSAPGSTTRYAGSGYEGNAGSNAMPVLGTDSRGGLGSADYIHGVFGGDGRSDFVPANA
jgi:hypothetical protein